MAFKFLKYKWQKITAATLLIFTATVLILAFVVNSYWSPVLAQKVKEVVLKSSDSLYTVDFSAAEMHVLRGTIVIYNIVLKPDTAKYNSLKKQHLAPNNLTELYVKRLTLSGVQPFKLYFKHRLEIGEIVINEPVLKVSYQLNHTKDTIVKDTRTPWQKMSKNLRAIHIGKILLGDVKFKYEDYSGNKVAVSELKEMDLSAFDLLIDSATQNDKSRLLYCKNIIANLNNYKGKTSNGLYTYKINSLRLSTLNSQLNINGLSLKPVNTGAFFNKSKKDRFTLRIDSVRLNHFDFLSYHKYRIINASSLVINRGAIQVFSNPNLNNDSLDRIKTFPHAALKTLHADIKIDTILISHFNVVYNEYNKKSGKTGLLFFNDTKGTVLNATTDKITLEKNNICSVHLSSNFMDRGKLDVTLNFNLTDKENSFTYRGDLGPMELKFVNPAAIPLGMVKITTGTLKRFSFDIHANSGGDWGKIELLYNNVSVVLLKADTVLDKLKRKPIATVFANTFFIKHSNPDLPGGIPRSAFVNYSRTKETPFFKSLWQTLFSGIKPCAGFDIEKQNTVIEMTNKQVIDKQNRKIKKEQRIERREERRKKREKEKLQDTIRGTF